MSRDIVDSSSCPDWLVGAARIERELTDELALQVDHADPLVGDQELHGTALVGPADADFVEAAVVAQADLAGLVDPVLAQAEVGLRPSPGRPRLGTGAVGS